ncbi:hypothetical protein [Natrinema salsiterrestre]|uniref:Uncharacterized protein n=1 Tax=Natrinema salsiterrestre TaxID=2950540 RepID=A0A9Q4KWQ9_9EURY|nr:hypothetical protein [Natrinema salsiterrestre]MDF9744355.1 hypothetical protein [Natrinema salsiterrestre]
MSTFPEPTDGESVDFLEERDDETQSWTRADPREALIESFGRLGDEVTLGDGVDVQNCALGPEDDEYLGRYECNGWQYHDGDGLSLHASELLFQSQFQMLNQSLEVCQTGV